MEAIAVSALTGQGLPELVAALGRLAARLPEPDPGGSVRLWLDRVFAIKGSGTVVTGTLQAGTVRTRGRADVLTPAMRTLRVRGVQSLGAPAAQVSGVARVALNLRGVSARELSRGMALIHAGRWTLASVIDVRLTHLPAGRQPSGTMRLPSRLTLHIGAARAVARVRMLGGRAARLSLDHPLPLHVGDRVLLRDPGAAADRATGRPVFGATVLDVSPPRLRGNGAAAAAERELASWPEPPTAPDLLRRHRLLRASTASAMGLQRPAAARQRGMAGRPGALAAAAPAAGGGGRRARGARPAGSRPSARCGPGRTGPARPRPGRGPRCPAPGRRRRRRRRRRRTGHRQRRVPAPRPRRTGATDDAGHRPAPGPRPADLPARVADAVQVVLADLADAPFSAPDAERMRELGLDARAAAAAERAGLLLRLPGNVLLAPDAPDRATRILAGLPQPFTAAEARKALQTSRRVVIPLLEWLDRKGITKRLADDRRTMREPPGSPRPNGER